MARKTKLTFLLEWKGGTKAMEVRLIDTGTDYRTLISIKVPFWFQIWMLNLRHSSEEWIENEEEKSKRAIRRGGSAP